MDTTNVFDLRKIEQDSVKELLLSIYKNLRTGESITFLDQKSMDWINQEINDLHLKSEKLENGLWSAQLSKNEKKECCGMCS